MVVVVFFFQIIKQFGMKFVTVGTFSSKGEGLCFMDIL